MPTLGQKGRIFVFGDGFGCHLTRIKLLDLQALKHKDLTKRELNLRAHVRTRTRVPGRP